MNKALQLLFIVSHILTICYFQKCYSSSSSLDTSVHAHNIATPTHIHLTPLDSSSRSVPGILLAYAYDEKGKTFAWLQTENKEIIPYDIATSPKSISKVKHLAYVTNGKNYAWAAYKDKVFKLGLFALKKRKVTYLDFGLASERGPVKKISAIFYDRDWHVIAQGPKEYHLYKRNTSPCYLCCGNFSAVLDDVEHIEYSKISPDGCAVFYRDLHSGIKFFKYLPHKMAQSAKPILVRAYIHNFAFGFLYAGEDYFCFYLVKSFFSKKTQLFRYRVLPYTKKIIQKHIGYMTLSHEEIVLFHRNKGYEYKKDSYHNVFEETKQFNFSFVDMPVEKVRIKSGFPISCHNAKASPKNNSSYSHWLIAVCVDRFSETRFYIAEDPTYISEFVDQYTSISTDTSSYYLLAKPLSEAFLKRGHYIVMLNKHYVFYLIYDENTHHITQAEKIQLADLTQYKKHKLAFKPSVFASRDLPVIEEEEGDQASLASEKCQALQSYNQGLPLSTLIQRAKVPILYREDYSIYPNIQKRHYLAPEKENTYRKTRSYERNIRRWPTFY